MPSASLRTSYRLVARTTSRYDVLLRRGSRPASACGSKDLTSGGVVLSGGRRALGRLVVHHEVREDTRRPTMKAAVVPALGAPLEIRDVPLPEAGHGQVVVRVEASGLCHTDIHAAHGDWPVKPTPPFVPGHEGVGLVEKLGEGVTHLSVGQRVAVPWLGKACGRCEHCLSGWETLCEQQINTGYGCDGGYAEKMLAWADFAQPVPDGISPFEAAPLTCAGVTTYKALKVADVKPAQLVAISGVGGLGHLAVQYAKIAGATVAAIDVTDEKLELASELGADLVIDARKDDVGAVLK